jgi:hypothetical protein
VGAGFSLLLALALVGAVLLTGAQLTVVFGEVPALG